jgi:hypothetical protein
VEQALTGVRFRKPPAKTADAKVACEYCGVRPPLPPDPYGLPDLSAGYLGRGDCAKDLGVYG